MKPRRALLLLALGACLAAAGHAEFGPIAEWDAARVSRMLEVHIGGTFNVCKHTLPIIKSRGRGSIVTSSK